MLQTTETEILAPFDCNTFEIWEVPLENTTIKFKRPLVLQPQILPPEEPGDETYLLIEEPSLNISVYADNRADLWDFVCSSIAFSWRHYVWLSDEQLVQRTRNFKYKFLEIAEEV